jgi:hypothetical protein
VNFYPVFERILKVKELIKELMPKDFKEDFNQAGLRFKLNEKFTN